MSVVRDLARGSGFGAMVGVAVMLAAFTLIDFSGWWTTQTLSNVIHFTSILGLIAMGQALVIISKEIDLSVGSVYGLVAVAFVTIQANLGVTGAMLAALAIAALCGLVQGIMVVKGRLPSMIVTLGGLFAFRGIIYVWTGGSVRAFPEEARTHWLTRLFGGEILGAEAALFWMLLVLGALSLLLWSTRFGNHLLASGGSLESAESRGVRTDRTKITAFDAALRRGARRGLYARALSRRHPVQAGHRARRASARQPRDGQHRAAGHRQPDPGLVAPDLGLPLPRR
jgi:simple sugar transport system permease protein